jgi:hypothetical protein
MANRRFRQMVAGAVGTAALGLGIVIGSSSPASAAPVTPNGLCGAKNMVNEHSVDDMREAMMLHTDEHGDAGMTRAVMNTLCA